MSRKKGKRRSAARYFTPKKPIAGPGRIRPADPAQSLSLIMSCLNPEQIAEGINNLIEALRVKGVEIRDYDQKDRIVYQVKKIRGSFYILAADPDVLEEHDGEVNSIHGTEKQEQEA